MKGINKIFIGFIFLVFRISFNHFDFFLPLLGTILITTGLWQLKSQNKNCKTAFVLSLISITIQIASFMVSCSKYSRYEYINVVLFILGCLIALPFMFNLFKGLEQIALKLNLTDVAKRIMKCFSLYFLAILFTAGAFLFAYLVVIVIILLIAIAVKLNRYKNAVLHSGLEVGETNINKRYWRGFFGIVLCTIIAFLFVLKISNAPPIKAVLYDKADVKTTAEVTKIKAKMESLKFDKDILKDLPNSEILKYSGIRRYHKTSEEFSVDGGKLLIETCVCTLPNYDYYEYIRFLTYYKWLEPPHSHFTDLIGQNLSEDSYFGFENDQNIGLLCLFDKDNGKGFTSYKITDMAESNNNAARAFKIPMPDKSCKNQRGYISFTVCKSLDSAPTLYNTYAVYIHQNIIFNVPFRNTFDFFAPKATPYDFQGKVFSTFYSYNVESFDK